MKISLTFDEKIAKMLFSNFFSKNVTFTKFLPKVRETKFQQFPHCVFVEMKNLLWSHRKNISSNHFFSKNVAFTKFLPKMRKSEFLKLPHCCAEITKNQRIVFMENAHFRRCKIAVCYSSKNYEFQNLLRYQMLFNAVQWKMSHT